jgi:ubiquitin C-terminal hydrolase
MKGLANLGNTCYLNAALQCLLHTPGLTNYVLSGWADKDLLKKRVNACALAGEYIALTRAYWTRPEPATVDPAGVWAALCKLHKPFANARPHDAHEALVLLLKHLHDALARTPRIEPSHAYDRVDRAAFDAHVAEDGYSILTELFCGQTECLVADDAGRYSSTTHEHFTGLQLDLEGCSGVAQALARAFAPVRLEGFRPGDGGGAAAPATQTRRLVYAPLVLVLHLKRFAPDGAKVDRFLDYPATLDLPAQGVYDLFAAVLHNGDHYVSLCEVRGQWRRMDDADVAPVDVNAVVSKDAYVLLYKKRL